MDNSNLQQQKEEKASITEHLIHEGRIICLKQDLIEVDQEPAKKFDYVLHPGAVVMIPIDENSNILLVKQWRRAAKQILIELPAGTLEEGEEVAFCAQRELQEEVGYKAEDLIPLGEFFSAPGFCNEYLYLFLALNLEESPLIGEDTHEIDLMRVSLDEAEKMIEKRQIVDAKTIAGIYLYKTWKQAHETI